MSIELVGPCPCCRGHIDVGSDQYGTWHKCNNCPYCKRVNVSEAITDNFQQVLDNHIDKEYDTSDPVNHPPHYKSDTGDIECIDAIKVQLGKEGFIAFLRGQVARYNWRLGKKDAAKMDAEKAQWYMNRLVGELDENTP